MTDYEENIKALEKIWCKCKEATNAYYVPDNTCQQCDIAKHHWHCEKCKGVCQIG